MLSVRDVGTLRLVLRMRRSWGVDMDRWVISTPFIRCRLLRKYLFVLLGVRFVLKMELIL